MDSGLLAEPVIGRHFGPHPLARPGMTNRGSILAHAEFTTGRGVAKASDAVAVAFDDRAAALEPLAVARHEARLFHLVNRPWDHPDIGGGCEFNPDQNSKILPAISIAYDRSSVDGKAVLSYRISPNKVSDPPIPLV